MKGTATSIQLASVFFFTNWAIVVTHFLIYSIKTAILHAICYRALLKEIQPAGISL